jgi:surface-adhesin protein E
MPFSIRLHRRSPLAYFSVFWPLIAFLVLSSGPACAEWVAIGSTDDGMTAYGDPDTIRRKGEMVKMWSLFDFQIMQYVEGIPSLSKKGESEYDCAEERLRLLALVEYSGNMGKGNVVYTGSIEQPWKPVVPRSVDQGLWKLACNKK